MLERILKVDIARRQLELAVRLFLNGKDRSSVITLAGAASGILDELVRRSGKEPFVDYAARVHRQLIGTTPKRRSYAHHIEKRLGIIAHKHLAPSDTNEVELDLEDLAYMALMRAVSEYSVLRGQDEAFVKAMLQWAWISKDGPSMMKAYEAVPARSRPKR